MNAIRTTRLALVGMSAAVALASAAGCTMPKASDFKPSNLFSLNSTWPWGDSDATREGTPVRVVGTWTDTVLHQSGQTPQRGFGGRLVFYGRDDTKPILVDGQLVVYAFDESRREPTDNKPTRRYVFPPDQMPLHMSKSELGASYSFWLPWDEAGGPKTEVSLICRFEPKDGAVITSEQTRNVLPGAIPANSSVAKEPLRLPEGVPARPARPSLEDLQSRRQLDPAMRLASYESPADAHAGAVSTTTAIAPTMPNGRMTVTSIPLPKDFQPHYTANHPLPRSATAAPALMPLQASQPQAAAMPSRPSAGTVGFGATPSASGPTSQRHAAGFGTMPLIRPQLLSPQPPTPAQPVGTPNVSYPPAAHSYRPAE